MGAREIQNLEKVGGENESLQSKRKRGKDQEYEGGDVERSQSKRNTAKNNGFFILDELTPNARESEIDLTHNGQGEGSHLVTNFNKNNVRQNHGWL